MDRIRRIAGMSKAKVPSLVQEDKDESVVFFRELYKREKGRDVNLLEPMYSVELDAIQGGHMHEVRSGKRDFLIAVDEKHDYDWLKTPPDTPLFPSLEMEANSSQMVFQKELPIPPRHAKLSASRVSGKPESTKQSAPSASPANESPAKKNFIKGDRAISKEKNQAYTIDKRSYMVPTNRHQKAASSTIAGTTNCSAPKKHSERCHGGQGSSTTGLKGATNPEFHCKATKNPITAGSIFRRNSPSSERARAKGPAFGADVKVESSKTRGQSCPPAATRGFKELRLESRQNVLPPRGKTVASSEPASNNNSDARLVKGTRRTNEKERRPMFGRRANK
ncbi:hypothetical protein ACP70R_000400 [Stipagrostis hirtigluma subsp. patula]